MLIPFIVGAVLGLGGSTGAVFFLGGGGEDSLTESLEEAMGEEHADSVSTSVAGAEQGDSAAYAASGDHAGEGHAAALGTSSLAAEVPGAPATEPSSPVITAMSGPAPAEGAMSAAELATLFATMQAREAARVLEHMEDNEVQAILGQLGNREAAAILSNLKPERAAVISRSILRGERSAP